MRLASVLKYNQQTKPWLSTGVGGGGGGACTFFIDRSFFKFLETFFFILSEADFFFLHLFFELSEATIEQLFFMIAFSYFVLPFRYIIQKWLFFSCNYCFICLFSSILVIFPFYEL